MTGFMGGLPFPPPPPPPLSRLAALQAAAQAQQALLNQSAFFAQQQQQLALGGYHGFGQANQAFYGGAFGSPGFANVGAFAGLAAQQAAFRPTIESIPSEGIRAGEVIAWRAWRVVERPNGWRLQSLIVDDIWEPDAPIEGKPDQFLGVFAVKDEDYARSIGGRSSLGAVGEVALWGDIHEHELGYRAETAAVHSLVLRVYREGFERRHKPGLWRRLFRHKREAHWQAEVDTITTSLSDAYGVPCTTEWV